LLTGDPAATDPVCSLAPTRPRVDAILTAVNEAEQQAAAQKIQWLYRPHPA
jgi:hypothetical protein